MTSDIQSLVRTYKFDDKLFNIWFVSEAKRTGYWLNNPDRVVPISEYNAIATHLKAITPIPRDILNILARTILLREEVRETYRQDGESKQDAGHEAYLTVLQTVRNTFDPFRNLLQTKQSRAPGSDEDGTRGTAAGTTNTNNIFDTLVTGSSSGSSPSETSDIDPKKDAMIALRGILIALRSHEQEICDAWTKFDDGLMPLCDASVITSLAISSVAALETEFQGLYKVGISQAIGESYRKECADERIKGFKVDIHDFTRFSIAEYHYILQFWITGKMWNKIVETIKDEDYDAENSIEEAKNAVSDTIIKMLLVPVETLNGRPDPPHLTTCHGVLTLAVERLWSTLATLNARDGGKGEFEKAFYPVQDPTTYLIIKKHDSRQPSLALAFAFKLHDSIDKILGNKTIRMPAEYEAICRSEYLTPIDRSLVDIRQACPGVAEEKSKGMLAEMYKALQDCKDSIMKMKDGVSKTDLSKAMRVVLLERDPVILGLWIAKCQITFNVEVLDILNRCSLVRDAAHVYNYIKEQGLLEKDWPDMECYLSLHPNHRNHKAKDAKAAKAETLTPLRTLFEANQEDWINGLSINKLVEILKVDDPDSTASSITMLRTCRERLAEEQKKLSFDYLGFLGHCRQYLERIREETKDEIFKQGVAQSLVLQPYETGPEAVFSVKEVLLATLDHLTKNGHPAAGPLLEAVVKATTTGYIALGLIQEGSNVEDKD